MQDRLRLISGLLLALFVVSHFTNHALGIISIEVQDWAAVWLTEIWNHPPLMFVFYTALLLHPALGLWTLQRRRHLLLPTWQRAQIWLGLLILPLLAPHLVKALMLDDYYHVDVNYPLVQFSLWVAYGSDGVVQGVLLLLVWAHASIGVWSWARLHPWYKRWHWLWPPLMWVLVTLALAGYIASGLHIRRLADADPELFSRLAQQTRLALEMLPPTLNMANWFQAGLLALVSAALMSPVLRRYLSSRVGNRPLLRYADRHRVPITPGATLLETLQQARINHPSLCGGRGRCSTCRVRVGSGSESLLPPSPLERQVLNQIGAPSSIRLACQTRAQQDLSAWPLLKANVGASDVLAAVEQRHGREMDVVVLFADLRGFTSFSERRLPFDVLFVLNRYFLFMGEAVESCGGKLDKFIGDGVMALFGLNGDVGQGCRDAIRAAGSMGHSLDQFNASLAEELSEPLRIGIGIHVGTAIVGEMGYGSARQTTAIGDTVNTASRLESLTKAYDAQVIISEAVFELANLPQVDYPLHQLEIRGRVEPMPARVLSSARELLELSSVLWNQK
ncbi:MAG: adenylate/guanylate cyclase domain-containing protein [Magnetococcales bacterium]|nr:adenylate/guanylate cyclase domain-containing protein [Magnetococcales bacterium]